VKLALIIVTIFRIKVLKKEKNIKEENKKSCDSIRYSMQIFLKEKHLS